MWTYVQKSVSKNQWCFEAVLTQKSQEIFQLRKELKTQHLQLNCNQEAYITISLFKATVHWNKPLHSLYKDPYFLALLDNKDTHEIVVHPGA